MLLLASVLGHETPLAKNDYFVPSEQLLCSTSETCHASMYLCDIRDQRRNRLKLSKAVDKKLPGQREGATLSVNV